MSNISINNSSYSQTVTGVSEVTYDNLGEKVYAAKKIEKLVGVWVSQPVWGRSDLLTWQELTIEWQKILNTDIYIYVKSGSTISNLSNSDWSGTYLNTTNDISDFKDRYLQFALVLVNNRVEDPITYGYNTTTFPLVSSVNITYLSSQSTVRFFSKTFEVGFRPERALLTYNGTIPTDTIVKFALTNKQSVNPSDYQYIDYNKIEELASLSVVSDKMKIMMEMIGSSDIPIIVDEISVTFSGDGNIYSKDLDIYEELLFSSSSSSSSSEGYSSSSSSSSSSSF